MQLYIQCSMIQLTCINMCICLHIKICVTVHNTVISYHDTYTHLHKHIQHYSAAMQTITYTVLLKFHIHVNIYPLFHMLYTHTYVLTYTV